MHQGTKQRSSSPARVAGAFVAVAGLIVAAVVAIPGTAQAHDADVGGPWLCGWSGVQYCGYGGVSDNHTWVYACDRSADGRGYFISYEYVGGGGGTTGDPNGSSSGCGGRDVPTVSRFRMCAWMSSGVAGCTGWTNA